MMEPGVDYRLRQSSVEPKVIHHNLNQCKIDKGTIFSSLLGVWKYGQTRSFVFDVLLKLVLRSSRFSEENVT